MERLRVSDARDAFRHPRSACAQNLVVAGFGRLQALDRHSQPIKRPRPRPNPLTRDETLAELRRCSFAKLHGDDNRIWASSGSTDRLCKAVPFALGAAAPKTRVGRDQPVLAAGAGRRRLPPAGLSGPTTIKNDQLSSW